MKQYISRFGSVIGLVVLMILITIQEPNFMSTTNLLNVLRQVSINGLIAFGMTFVILIGGIDLSVGSIFALTSAVMADLLVKGVNPLFAILVALTLGAILGVINGLLITKGKLQPFIATLGTMTLYRGLVLVYTSGMPITKLGDSQLFRAIGRGYFLGIPIPAVILFIIFIIVWFFLTKHVFGRYVYAVGGNETTARLSSINVDKVKTIVFGINGTLAALSGIILTSRLNSAQAVAGSGYELDAIAAVVLGGTSLSGGKGKILGTLVGVLIIGVLNNGLNILGVSSFYQQVVKGAVILVAVLLDRKN